MTVSRQKRILINNNSQAFQVGHFRTGDRKPAFRSTASEESQGTDEGSLDRYAVVRSSEGHGPRYRSTVRTSLENGNIFKVGGDPSVLICLELFFPFLLPAAFQIQPPSPRVKRRRTQKGSEELRDWRTIKTSVVLRLRCSCQVQW